MGKGLFFGTAGIPNSTKTPGTLAGLEQVHELGLDCMELEFVRGVNMSTRDAREAGKRAFRLGIRLSAHAPYYINLNAKEPEKVAASRERIMQTARITALFGGQSVVFHPAYYLRDDPSKVYDSVKNNVEQLVAQLKAENITVKLRPELMGKESQFGTLDEILQLCTEVEGIAQLQSYMSLARNVMANDRTAATVAAMLVATGVKWVVEDPDVT